jgi:hypothetical protein
MKTQFLHLKKYFATSYPDLDLLIMLADLKHWLNFFILVYGSVQMSVAYTVDIIMDCYFQCRRSVPTSVRMI